MKKRRRLIAFCMALCMVAATIFSGIGTSLPGNADYANAAEDKYAGYVYFTTEKITLGQGFVIKPVKVGFYEGDTIADITERALGDKSGYTGVVDDSYYLTSVIDGGEPQGWTKEDIPAKIREAIASAGYTLDTREKTSQLSSFDYTGTSGWMFGLNNVGISVGAGKYVYKGANAAGGSYTYSDGDVIRLQFSVYNWGQDLNTWDPSWGGDPLISFPDKDALIRLVADYIYETDATAYVSAMAVLEDWDATVAEVTDAENALKAYMADKEETTTETSSTEEPSPEEPQDVHVTITMNAISTTMTLTDSEGKAVEIGEPENRVYSLDLEPGKYMVTGIGTDAATVNGTVSIVVTEEEEQAFNIQTVTAYCTNAGWIYGTDYLMENLTIKSSDGTIREDVTMGVHTTYPDRKTFIVVKGDAYEFRFVPIGDKADAYVSAFYSGTVTANTTKSFKASEKRNLTVTIPYADSNGDSKNDYQLEVGTLTSYYIYTYLEEIDAQRVEDTEVYSYNAANGSSYFYRVTNPYDQDAVTYGNYTASLTADTEVAVTEADLYVNVTEGTDYDKNTVIKGMTVNAYDVADIYLTANERGCINMEVGETYTLYPVRNWMAIEGISNAKVIEPDFHYTVLDTNGNVSSDVVSVTENMTNTTSRHSAQIQAKGEGTAIILVTYDAMTNMQGYSAAASTDKTFFSAIWPENTGVVVVTVGRDGSIDTGMDIHPGMNVDSKESGDAIDAEGDVLYYTGEKGAKYTFAPESGVTVKVATPSISGNHLSYTGFSESNVKVNRNGTVTVSGLTEGANIIELSKGDAVTYQVIRAKELDYSMSAVDAEGNPVEGDIMPGDTVTITLDTVYHPVNKLSGYYNFSAQAIYETPEGEQVKGASNQYLFATTEKAQQLTVTIPEDYMKSKYTLTNGTVYSSGFGSPYGQHRTVTYENGKPANFTAVSQKIYLGVLPDIVIPVSQDENTISDTYEDVLEDTIDYIRERVADPVVDSVGGEWAVISLARYGYVDEDWYHAYYENVVDALLEEDSNKLSSNRSTENARAIIALTAIGADPSDVHGYDLIAPLSDMSYVTRQGVNGGIYALLAIDASGYEFPETEQIDSKTVTRESLIEYILSRELSNGGWALSGGDAAVDVTAMAIQALAPYYEEDAEVKAAVDRALVALSDAQQEDGGFICYGDENAESTAQVVAALCVLGINPEEDYDFIKNGNSAIDALLSFYDEDVHAFCHTTEINQMSTEQGAYALVAYDRLLKERNSLYDMRDAESVYIVDIGNSSISLSEVSFVSDGNAKEPNVTVIENGRILTPDIDYIFVYSDNVNAGIATVLITGMGSHTGTVTVTFEITEPASEDDNTGSTDNDNTGSTDDDNTGSTDDDNTGSADNTGITEDDNTGSTDGTDHTGNAGSTSNAGDTDNTENVGNAGNANDHNSGVKTGDDTMIMIWMIVFAVSGLGAFLVERKRRQFL